MFPQLLYIFIVLSTMAFWALKHGEPQNEPHPGPVTLVFAYSLVIGLYAWGGLFVEVGIPEYLLLGFLAVTLAYEITKAGTPKKPYNFFAMLSLCWVTPTLLYFGGFFDPLIG